jgi:hypothetical protein
MTTRLDFATLLLNKLDRPTCNNNIISMLAWMAYENTDAAYNPLATERDYPGATDFNEAGVKNYPDLESGINATIEALTNGLYGEILADLANCADPETTCAAISASRWGSHPSSILVNQVRNDIEYYGGLVVYLPQSEVANQQLLSSSPPYSNVKEEEMLEAVAKNPQDQLMADLLLTWAIVNPNADRISDEDMPGLIKFAEENGAAATVRELFDNAETIIPHSLEKDLER